MLEHKKTKRLRVTNPELLPKRQRMNCFTNQQNPLGRRLNLTLLFELLTWDEPRNIAIEIGNIETLYLKYVPKGRGERQIRQRDDYFFLLSQIRTFFETL
jgi:hypothetical protein